MKSVPSDILKTKMTEETIMKFCWVTINVRDMSESIKFYEEIVGLPVMNQISGGPDTHIAFLGAGDTQVELVCRTGRQEVTFGGDISIGFMVPSLDEMIAFLNEKGIDIKAGPFQPNPFVKFIFVDDPNGVKIQFVESKR